MQMNVVMSKLNSVLGWVTKLAYLNVLWVLFSLIGFIVIGFFPATVAMMAICRKWLNGEAEAEIPLFRTFLKIFKSELLQSNLLGWIMFGIGLLLYMNFLVLQSNAGSVNIVLVLAFYLFVFFYIITLTHALPLYVHYHVSALTCIKNAFIMSFVNIHISVAIIISLSAFYYLMFSYPASALFFLGSVLSIIQMWLVLRSFKRIEKKAGTSGNVEGTYA